MKLLNIESENDFLNCIKNNVCGDYIYDYPPRQTYRKFETGVWSLIQKSIDFSDNLNLYFHFPFCKQICAYCNLFTLNDLREEKFKEYFDSLFLELGYFKSMIMGKKINSIYLGGGTPSLIPIKYISHLFEHLLKDYGIDVFNISEVTIELSPETVQKENIQAYRSFGINRVSIGVQSVDNFELSCVGRKYSDAQVIQALELILGAGFKNVCVDLIYGLEGQTDHSWKSSLHSIVDFRPPTICPYPLTLRPETGFSMHDYTAISGKSQYDKYDYTKKYLLENGYTQDTHIRYSLKNSNGGYVQKENHWNMENILGFGAGARSYLYYLNYRNGYSVLNRKNVYDTYISKIADSQNCILDGFIMNSDEIQRKAIILGLKKIDIEEFTKKYDSSPYALFPQYLNWLEKFGLITCTEKYIALSDAGTRYRDVIVQLFFSEHVKSLIEGYSYKS
ncbi:coproporphyrinogen III oxidase [Clostridia bacterium]|nr:coproporphyrinogen III oxidase [Clostridia bacterium]